MPDDDLTGYWTRPERYAHKGQVMEDQCRACRHRIDTGERAFDRPVLGCRQNLKPPRNRICPMFALDEGSELMQEG